MSAPRSQAAAVQRRRARARRGRPARRDARGARRAGRRRGVRGARRRQREHRRDGGGRPRARRPRRRGTATRGVPGPPDRRRRRPRGDRRLDRRRHRRRRRTGCDGSTPRCGPTPPWSPSPDPAATPTRPGGPPSSRPRSSSSSAGCTRATGRLLYLTATNVAFRREGFPGYDVRLTQGGDEVDLRRRLQAWGPVAWDGRNVVRTSSRRMDFGLVHTVVVSFGYHYGLNYALGRLLPRPAARTGPRDPDGPGRGRPSLAPRLAGRRGAPAVVLLRRAGPSAPSTGRAPRRAATRPRLGGPAGPQTRAACRRLTRQRGPDERPTAAGSTSAPLALVVGGSRGLGLAAARVLARRGYRLVPDGPQRRGPRTGRRPAPRGGRHGRGRGLRRPGRGGHRGARRPGRGARADRGAAARRRRHPGRPARVAEPRRLPRGDRHHAVGPDQHDAGGVAADGGARSRPDRRRHLGRRADRRRRTCSRTARPSSGRRASPAGCAPSSRAPASR